MLLISKLASTISAKLKRSADSFAGTFAIALSTAALIVLEGNIVAVARNDPRNQVKCLLETEKLEDAAKTNSANYPNFRFNQHLIFDSSHSGIVVTFAPQNNRGEKIELKQLASALGYERFAWVNYVERDPHGMGDRHGKILQTPYNDPPPGGYQYEAADNHPFYWDIELCDNCRPRHHYQHPQITDKYRLVFEDHPYDPRLESGESVDFVTHLVGVSNNSLNDGQNNWDILTTFSWKLITHNPATGRVSLLESNLDPLQLSPALLAQIQADGGKVTNFAIVRKDNFHNHQCQPQNHQSQYLDRLF